MPSRRSDVSVDARAHSDRGLEQPVSLERAHGIRERDGQRAAGQLEIGDASAVADPRADRHELAVQ